MFLFLLVWFLQKLPSKWKNLLAVKKSVV